MSEISIHVGQRIKKYRKSNGLTIEQFATQINKSKATLSKYENGTITIDIETLLEIADALDIHLTNLIDYNSPKIKPQKLQINPFFDQTTYYVYYYDGRTKKTVRSLMSLSAPDELSKEVSVVLHNGLETFDNLNKCMHIFTGQMNPYDTMTHFYLTNQINPTERMYICLLNPMHAHSQAVGITCGLGSTPFFAPIALKTLISKEALEENDAFMHVLKLGKEDYRMLKYYNMMVINRPVSLFLTPNP